MPKNDIKYLDTLTLITKFIPQACLNRARGHEVHIRATNVNSKQLQSFLNNCNTDQRGRDSRYSTSYETIFMTHNGEYAPLVLSCGEFRVNKNDSLVPKQLTAKKLNIAGTYTNVATLSNKIKTSLGEINPQLNSGLAPVNNSEFTIFLIKLSEQIIDPTQTLTLREQKLLKNHKASLGKDFGEILAALYVLKAYGNVTIPSSESNANFDLSYSDNDGIINKVNIKSGNGSGQSFNCIKYELSILNEEDYEKGTPAHICIAMMRALCEDVNIKGRDRIFNMAKEAQKLNVTELLSRVLSEISAVFFNEKTITKENYNPPTTYKEYLKIVQNIYKKFSLSEIGLPIRSNEENPDNFYSNNANGKENAILFTLGTIIANFFDNKILTNVMKKLINNKIFIIHVGFDNNGANFTTPAEITYKFHYWGNYKNPTNNLPGFKSIYKK